MRLHRISCSRRTAACTALSAWRQSTSHQAGEIALEVLLHSIGTERRTWAIQLRSALLDHSIMDRGLSLSIFDA